MPRRWQVNIIIRAETAILELVMFRITRRAFLTASLGAASRLSASNSTTIRFAAIADTHIIDEFYKGPEGNSSDSESIFKTKIRLEAVRAHLNTLKPKLDCVFVLGDYFHNYPSFNLDFFFQHRTRVDIAKELTDGFKAPVHIAFGNHDYAVPQVSRETSHELFRRKLSTKPYHSATYKGCKFVCLNNCLGDTWKVGHPSYKKGIGSFGEDQLNWFEAELRQHKPTFVFLHFPLGIVAPTERAGYGIRPLLDKYADTIQHVFAGHRHKWLDYGRNYGPLHTGVAATRYDENAYLIVEADSKRAEHRLLNSGLVEWGTHFAKPYRP